MDRLTLREAAERTSRSITTLRRYIRSGRLHAEKRYGRFGPEYYVSSDDLSDAGLDPAPPVSEQGLATRDAAPAATTSSPSTELTPGWLQGIVPISLFQELQMKHEQLLVQYGMVRSGGLRMMELQAEADRLREERDATRRSIEQLRAQHARELELLRSELREARLELEGRQLELDAYQEKVRALEMLTRNAVTNESIDHQFREVMDQTRRVDELRRDRTPAGPVAWDNSPPAEPDH